MLEDFDYSTLGILPGEDQDQLANGGYAPAVPPSPDMTDLGVSSLAPPSSADLGAPAVSPPPSQLSGGLHDFLRMRAPDLGPSGSDGGGGGAVSAPKAPAPMPGPFSPFGFRGAPGMFGFRGR